MDRFGKDEMTSTVLPDQRETIVALSTPVGMSAVAVVRISGAESQAALLALCGVCPEPRRVKLLTLHDPETMEELDQAMVLWLPGPKTYSGEDMVELSLHGSRAVIASVIDALCRLDGLRLAEPGEFTRRAFEAGKLSLSQIEGLNDLLHAETSLQRRQSLAELRGVVDIQAEQFRHGLIEMLAHVEALIEFPDEEDAAGQIVERQAAKVRAMRQSLQAALLDARRSTMIRDGLQVVIAGPPNAGKSSLLNAFAGSDVAIVSAIPGTTRDMIEVALDLDGIKVRLIDTAGLRNSADEIEQEGIRRAKMRIEDADLVLYVQDAGVGIVEFLAEGDRFVSELRLLRNDAVVWQVANKLDDGVGGECFDHPLSIRFGHGMKNLRDDLVDWCKSQLGDSPFIITQARHRQIYGDIVGQLLACEQMLDADNIDLAAEHLRFSIGLLGRISGRIGVEEVLDSLFSSFCIGK